MKEQIMFLSASSPTSQGFDSMNSFLVRLTPQSIEVMLERMKEAHALILQNPYAKKISYEAEDSVSLLNVEYDAPPHIFSEIEDSYDVLLSKSDQEAYNQHRLPGITVMPEEYIEQVVRPDSLIFKGRTTHQSDEFESSPLERSFLEEQLEKLKKD